MANTTSLILLVRGLIDDKLKTDGRNVYEYTGDNVFTLTESFISSSSILVFRNGTHITIGYSYNSTTNEITITALAVGDIIEVRYSYYAKYSDTEILGYIDSALCYFVQYRYVRVFEVNGINVIANPGTNPSKNELRFIAIITAILIEPNNIKIQTKEFTINGKEEKSASDQIKEAFAKWTRNFGVIEFLEDDTSVW
jgi:hypothetical protein